ncbi:MAG: hypothetical protein PHQ58_04735 [Rhodoferax sp.]|uniref:hypothetical protein n=1 Tax=Rhodoferax sp. TaxID=50421 RepID=UPI00261F4C19|nr:hypothetical protein [Rhodoferax sp.]MDD2879719.1 hypothetical protein [Rhodoferax sp.]
MRRYQSKDGIVIKNSLGRVVARYVDKRAYISVWYNGSQERSSHYPGVRVATFSDYRKLSWVNFRKGVQALAKAWLNHENTVQVLTIFEKETADADETLRATEYLIAKKGSKPHREIITPKMRYHYSDF